MTPSLLEHPLQYLVSRLEAGAARQMVGLAGTPGSGKSTLAARLVEQVNARTAPGTAVALGMDGFHLTKAQLRAFPDPEAAFARRGAPWTFDTKGFLVQLERLRAGAEREAVAWPDFQHEVGDPVEAAFSVAPDTRLVLVEGLYLLHDADGWDAIGACFDELWFLDTPSEIALERLAKRHMQAWKLSRGEAEARISTNDGLNAQIVQASGSRAQWRVTGE